VREGERGGRNKGVWEWRGSLWTDLDMGTQRGTNEAWPPLTDFTGLGWVDGGVQSNLQDCERKRGVCV
jgi:hypothetical protein